MRSPARRERSMYRRILITTTSVLFLLLTTTYLFFSEPLSSVVEQEVPIMHSIPLQVILSKESSANSNLGSATIHVIVKNTSPSPVYLLLWSSPLDPRAVAMGTVKFVSSKTNTTALCLNIKINRKVPKSGYFSVEDDHIMMIPADGTAQRDLEAREPEVALAKGEKYLVKAQGHWMGVWTQENDGKNIEKLSVEDGLTGEFDSNTIEIEIPAEGGEEL
ncbi:hypothetical protein LAWI1_G003934 [Lachnellula willkommii]|uniref:Uncharacterized protein n=1 Tax=Lachnellula willkommii TaxID=215461 RepID=A0A559M8I2_9HELO|nr:hypothetical protein LAWI1_G003934 [Lachnellula willkommii]